LADRLAGKQIVNTRALHQAAELDDLIRERGAIPVSYPCIDIAPPYHTDPLDDGLNDCVLGKFDWLVVTSQNTAIALARRVEALRLRPEALKVRIAAVGPATAAAVEELLGLDVALMPDEYVAEALAESLKQATGNRVFLPQSSLARDTLEYELRATGLHVTTAVAYRTVAGSGGENVPALLKEKQIDAVIFTSASTVHHFVDRIKAEEGQLSDLEGVCLASIGPVTAAAIEQNWLTTTVVADVYTLDGILDALEKHFSAED